ncbi:MAG: M48 family metalloprotease [Rhodospirillaceae bacterium]
MKQENIATVYQRRDRRQTALYVLVMLAIPTACGWFVASWEGAVLAMTLPLFLIWVSPRLSPNLIMRMEGAIAAQGWQYSALNALTLDLAAKADLKAAPQLYVHPSRMITAFAVGTDEDSAIALSRGALETLGRRELAGVLAHEIAHIAAEDSKLTVFSKLVYSTTSIASLVGLMLCVVLSLADAGIYLPFWLPIAFAIAPICVNLLDLALSRQREFAADTKAVELTRDPWGLVRALDAIRHQERSILRRVIGLAIPRGRSTWLRTHPPTEERIERLVHIGRSDPDLVPLNRPALPPFRRPLFVRILRPS